ncbi:GA module-containing protein, partial [Dolosigranulum pigrum]|uniref:GA module-containing protein n=1 Tax=Dolosigranulum pigrum TaxID=29394 RepID=UPI000DC385F4
EKDVFKEDIGQATTIEEVEGLVAEAKAFVDERVTAEQSLEAEKQAAKTVIESLTLLSGPAKATLTEAVEQAQRSEEVESILELAQEKEDGLNHIAGL